MHIHPFSNPLTPTPERGQLKDELTKKSNPCSKSTSFLVVFSSRFRSIRPDKHTASCQHKISTSAKRKPNPRVLGPAGGTLEGRVPCTEICQISYCSSKTKPRHKTKPPKNHPNKTLSTIKIIKNILFLT